VAEPDPSSLSPSEHFDRLYAEHAPAVLAYFERRLPREEAHDASAELFTVVWRRIDRVPLTAPLPWLFASARHVLANHRRSMRRRRSLVERVIGTGRREHSPSGETPEAAALGRIDQDEIIAALRTLPERDQEVLTLVEWDGLTRAEVAEAFGVSRSAIDKRIDRAYRKLRRLLEARGDTIEVITVEVDGLGTEA
jgi:RNA polymerase sigma-70 factor (ECF subfamily)